MSSVRRIAVTGGPGGGKTTIWRALSQAHDDVLEAVPEVATLMFAHVFPAVQSEAERCAVQRAIYHVQHNLELAHEARARPGQILLCDRGTPDGGGYWPSGPEAFFAAVGSRWEDELLRYEAVLFLETAAAGGFSIADNNPVRTEDARTAVEIDQRLYAVWSRHPRFVHVQKQPDFAVKVALGSAALGDILGR
jgi:predicted ATPase